MRQRLDLQTLSENDPLEKFAAKTNQKDNSLVGLSLFISYLNGLKLIHHAHHWQSKGSNFYGDHLMFQRLYEVIDGEIDVLAEKLIGLSGSAKGTSFFVINEGTSMFLDTVGKGKSLVEESFDAETIVVELGTMLVETWRETGLLTPGLEQAIGDVLNKHEEHMYLLERRLDQ